MNAASRSMIASSKAASTLLMSSWPTAMPLRLLHLGTLRRHESRPRPAVCAASNRGQFKESSQSNQQDLIGEMKTNGQQETTRGPGLLVQAACQPQDVGLGQYGEGCLERRTECPANGSARRDQGAFATLALPGPAMRMIATTFRALPLECCVAMSWRGGMLALAAVRMVRAAAHHQVNYQHRDAQDAGQPDHTTPHLPVIRYRPQSFAIFRRTGRLAARGIGCQL